MITFSDLLITHLKNQKGKEGISLFRCQNVTGMGCTCWRRIAVICYTQLRVFSQSSSWWSQICASSALGSGLWMGSSAAWVLGSQTPMTGWLTLCFPAECKTGRDLLLLNGKSLTSSWHDTGYGWVELDPCCCASKALLKLICILEPFGLLNQHRHPYGKADSCVCIFCVCSTPIC